MSGSGREPTGKRSREFGLLAEFERPADLLHACRRIRDAGFTRWDAHAPFPVHGLSEAMGLASSPIPWFVLVLGLTGAALGMLLQGWVSVGAWPLVISGKPLFSWPAFVPIMFECGVLGGALGAVFGFLLKSGLPRPYHAVFRSEAFKQVTNDRFFVSIEAADPRYGAAETRQLLEELGAHHVECLDA